MSGLDQLKYWLGFVNIGLDRLISKKKKALWALFMDRVQLPQGWNHFEEPVYFLPLSVWIGYYQFRSVNISLDRLNVKKYWLTSVRID